MTEFYEFVEEWMREQADLSDFRSNGGIIMYHNERPHIAGLIKDDYVKIITPDGPAVLLAAEPEMFSKLKDALICHREYRKLLASWDREHNMTPEDKARREAELNTLINQFLVREVVEDKQ